MLMCGVQWRLLVAGLVGEIVRCARVCVFFDEAEPAL